MMDDLISRATAIKCVIDAVDDWEGGWNPNREVVIKKYFEELPAVTAISVEWLRQEAMKDDGVINSVIRGLLIKWQKEQE
jgi:hypothetical protein